MTICSRAEHVVDLGEELLRGGAGAGRCPGPVMAGDPVEEEHGLAQGLARDRAGAQAHPAQTGLLLDDGRPLAQLGRLDGRPLTRRTATDAYEVIVVCPGRSRGSRSCGGTHVGGGDDSIAGDEFVYLRGSEAGK